MEPKEQIEPIESTKQNNKPLVSVVVPAYNEAPTIEKNLARLYEYLESLRGQYRWELIVVDDGSDDQTGEMINKFATNRPEVIALHHIVNFNLGQALRFAFNNCNGHYIVTLDSDLSYSPDHIGRLLEAIIKTKAKIVIASPYMKGGKVSNVPWMRRILSKWANRFLNLPIKGEISTLTGMVRIYDREFLRALNLKSMDVGINLEIIYKAQLLHARILEIPAYLEWSEERHNNVSRGFGLRISRSIATCLFYKVIFNPFLFFILPAGILFLISISLIFAYAFHVLHVIPQLAASKTQFNYEFINTINAISYYRLDIWFLGGISLIFAFQLIGIGIVALLNKYYFEELFHLGTTVYKVTQEGKES